MSRAETHQHGTCVSVAEAGVLLLGASGSGKSDLGLRLIDQPGCGISGRMQHARLVADDQVIIRLAGDRLVASAPPALAGKLEIRGLGLVDIPQKNQVALVLAVRLAPAAMIERMPDLGSSRFGILGIFLPLISIDPTFASAPARIRAAVDWLGRSRNNVASQG